MSGEYRQTAAYRSYFQRYSFQNMKKQPWESDRTVPTRLTYLIVAATSELECPKNRPLSTKHPKVRRIEAQRQRQDVEAKRVSVELVVILIQCRSLFYTRTFEKITRLQEVAVTRISYTRSEIRIKDSPTPPSAITDRP